ncbi:PTS system IIB component, L-Asc family [Kosakonia arachidis]|uniref:PTS system IIB component, L-Asc family n=2 Tax=Kosakonia arachidis TaxID=551989 RepID=A0A1I7CUL4_9ENTR|nr:PTS system IIB component, L-Asc family [Kosakonia arachidis]
MGDAVVLYLKKVNTMKIMAICGSGLGSSFMVEMNIKKVLKKLNIEAEVEHSDLSSATPGAADVFVMAKDIAASASVPESQLVVLSNIIDINELEAKISAFFANR